MRRVLTAGLSLGAVVATAAVANAAGHGDGFLGARPHATAMNQQMNGQQMNGQQMNAQQGGMMQAMTTTDARRSTMCQTGAPMSDTWRHMMNGDQMTSHPASDMGMGANMGMGRMDADLMRTPFGGSWWKRGHLTIKPFVNKMDPAFNQLLGINDRGVIVGYFGSGADAMHPNKGYLVNPPYRQGDIVSRNVPDSVQTQEIGINDARVQVGFSIDKKGVTSGFVRLGDKVRLVHNPLSLDNPKVDQLLGVNNRGWAAGFYNDGNGNSHGYVYNICTGSFTGVHIPAAHNSLQATGINDMGVVSGFYVTGKTTHGFVLDNGKFKSIDLGNKMMTQVLGLNDAGDLVGSFEDGMGATHGFVWSHGHLRVVDVPHATGTVVNGLNNRGQLVGFFMTKDNRTVGFRAW